MRGRGGVVLGWSVIRSPNRRVRLVFLIHACSVRLSARCVCHRWTSNREVRIFRPIVLVGSLWSCNSIRANPVEPEKKAGHILGLPQLSNFERFLEMKTCICSFSSITCHFNCTCIHFKEEVAVWKKKKTLKCALKFCRIHIIQEHLVFSRITCDISVSGQEIQARCASTTSSASRWLSFGVNHQANSLVWLEFRVRVSAHPLFLKNLLSRLTSKHYGCRSLHFQDTLASIKNKAWITFLYYDN